MGEVHRNNEFSTGQVFFFFFEEMHFAGYISPKDGRRKTSDPNQHGKQLFKANLFICVPKIPPPKTGLKRSTLDLRKTRFM